MREPDIAFVRQDRIPADGVPDGFWPGAPDLAVEVTSPGDRPSEIRAKVSDYLARGVRLVWVVDPKKKTVTTHNPLSTPVTLGVDDVLDAGDVVPGFSLPGPSDLRLTPAAPNLGLGGPTATRPRAVTQR